VIVRRALTAIPDTMVKRALDIAVSAAALVLLAPLFGLLALAIWATSSGPAFYRGIRIGKRGRAFEILKFRTMRVDAERDGASSSPIDDPRLTRIGAFLRAYKLDEVSQLWNVLVGEMSLVGPRPQVPWAVERYSDEEKILLTVRPGITDPASLRFANEGEILRGQSDPDRAYFELIHPEKMRLSIEYVKNRSFLGDLKIIVATVRAVLGRPPGRIAGPEHDRSTS
jgi:lipopolysaccharide/colanic/teichoic acid biosynthesis glycosyltransferase